MSSQRWQPSPGTERRKLCSSPGWALCSSASSSSTISTRRSTAAAAKNGVNRVDLFGGPLSSMTPAKRSADEVDCNEEELEENDNSSNSTTATSKSRPSTRIIMERNSLQRMMERHILCPKYSDAVFVSFPTVCIASGCKLVCSNKMCGFTELETPSLADAPLPDGSRTRTRTTDYAANIQFVMSYLASGDGGKEAERLLGLLGLLGLPNSATMEKRSFGIIESRLSPTIIGFTEEILMENLRTAVRVYYDGRRDNNSNRLLFDMWTEQVNSPDEVVLLPAMYPKLTVSADMAWQKRSSGNRYDSNSGHATLVEATTRKPIRVDIRCKICNICTANTNDEVRMHKCTINHTGSSGSMEPISILNMVIDSFNINCVLVNRIVTDDDSTIKAKLKWSNEDYKTFHNTGEAPKIINRNGNEVYRQNHGMLPVHIPEPSFLADPNHRKKTLKGELYRHLKKPIAQRGGLTQVDIMRVTTNFAYMVRSLPAKATIEESYGKAIVEHHFDNHEYCGNFCKRKTLTADQAKQTAKIYRCKVKDGKLYKFLCDTVARFITLEALKEVGHGMDTQVNESLNNTISWLAPKNKTYSGSSSLENRISIAIGIHSIGTSEYFVRLFGKLGVEITGPMQHYLSKQQQTRVYRIDKYKRQDVKKARNLKLHDKLKEYSEKVKK